MAFSSLFGVVTLQVATAILASVFFVVSVLVMGINVFSYENEDIDPVDWPVNLTLVWLFSFLMNVTGWFLFLSSYIPSRPLCYVSMLFIALVVVYWGTLTIISFINHPKDVRCVCVGYRCAESFWIASLRFRSHPFFGVDVVSLISDETDIPPYRVRPLLTKPVNRWKLVLKLEPKGQMNESTVNDSVNGVSEFSTVQNPPRKEVKSKRFRNTNLHIAPSFRDEEIRVGSKRNDHNYTSMSRVVQILRMKKKLYDPEDNQYDNPEDNQYDNSKSNQYDNPEEDAPEATIDVGGVFKIGSAFVGAVLFALLNLFFFLLSMVTVWCYSQELKWINPREKRYQTQTLGYEIPI